jgi:hypothetical protein
VIASHRFQLPDLNITTKVPDHELYAWETLLSRMVNIVARMSSLLQSWCSLLAMSDRVLVFIRYTSSGASAIQPFDFTLHLLPQMLRMDVTVHESDNGMPNTFEYGNSERSSLLSRTLGILSLLDAFSPAVQLVTTGNLLFGLGSPLYLQHVSNFLRSLQCMIFEMRACYSSPARGWWASD